MILFDAGRPKSLHKAPLRAINDFPYRSFICSFVIHSKDRYLYLFVSPLHKFLIIFAASVNRNPVIVVLLCCYPFFSSHSACVFIEYLSIKPISVSTTLFLFSAPIRRICSRSIFFSSTYR